MNGEDTQFKPGGAGPNKPGAPKGNKNAKKAAAWKRALEGALERFAKKFGDVEDYREIQEAKDRGLARIADVVVAAAADGDRDCWQEIANRLDGKVAQQIIATGDEDGGPIQVEGVIKLRRPTEPPAESPAESP